MRACLWLVDYIIAAFNYTVKILIGHKSHFFVLYPFISSCRNLVGSGSDQAALRRAGRVMCLPQS